jgi:NAD(P) transhydrogenase subunit alpha
MRIAVPREAAAGEGRVALVPETVGRLVSDGFEVVVERGAGAAAGYPDEGYTDAGATLREAGSLLEGADTIVRVARPTADEVSAMAAGTILIGFLSPLTDPEGIDRLRRQGVVAFAMESIPRISRAQSMDALSSQANVAGYKAVLIAADRVPRLFPMLMTAAGTIAPARVLIMGAGVAGLQAIATCRRLGAVVKGYDVRAAAAEEIRSMGASAIDLGLPSLDGAGGYAREMTEERAAKQQELLAPYIAAADVLITTAAVPGRQAPLLVSSEMVAAMAAGSVVVDLAAEQGGNVAGSIPGDVVLVDCASGSGAVTLWGGANVPSQMPNPASRLYAQNLFNVIMLMTRENTFAPDFDDEVVAGMCVTRDGEVLRQ